MVSGISQDRETQMRSAALPVQFQENFAFFHPASGNTGYVICPSWGYDEICSRKFLRCVAEDLAENGNPVLRFDYPGTINMLDVDGGPTLDDWAASAHSAADQLKELSGCENIVFLGFGIGTAVAFQAGTKRDDVAGLVLAAPTPSGRRYMRELQIQAQVADESLGLDLSGAHGETGFSGFFMPQQLQKSLKACKLSPDGALSPIKTLILCRPENQQEKSFATTLSEAGWPVTCEDFEGYLELLATPTTSVLPQTVMDRILEFADDKFPAEPSSSPRESVTGSPVVKTDVFTEEPVRFGSDQQYFGVLCQPASARRGPVLLFLNTGFCHHIGWGRIYVRAARYLAERGIATFRVDLANIGESPAQTGRTTQVLYTDSQFKDTGAALDYLKSRGLGPLVLIGRCSGAYVAFHTAAANEDVDGVMLINQLRLIWDSEENVYDALNFGARPLAEYRRRALSLETVKRLVRGDIDVRRALGHIANHIKDRLVRRAAPYLGPLTKLGRFRKACHARFAAMAERDIPVKLLNCEVDGSLDELARYFEADLSGLNAYPNVQRTIIENADHNLTPEPAQTFLLQQLEAMAMDQRWDRS